MPPKARKRSVKKEPAKAAPRDDRGKRLLDLVVMLLGARQPVPYREIRAQFKAYRTAQEEAGLRAFERDKADLLELGVPLRYVTPADDDAVAEPGYTVAPRRYRLPEIHLTSAEVAALVLAGSVARAAPGTTYAEVVDLALKKLAFDSPPTPDGVPGPPGKRPPEPVLVHFPRPAEAAALAETLAQLQAAIGWRNRASLRYVTAGTGQAATRAVDPYGLAYREGAWYLVGWCHLRQGVRTFRIDRMAALTVAAKPKTPDFERPPGFDVRRYASRSPWTFEIEPPVTVELEVRPEGGAVANEDFGDGAERRALGNGGILVRWSCGNPDYVVARILAAKGALVARAPEALRARVRAELGRTLARY